MKKKIITDGMYKEHKKATTPSFKVEIHKHEGKNVALCPMWVRTQPELWVKTP